jgi:hypothetical protein
MRVVGLHEWLLLPLAPNLRDPGVTWQDEAYYINHGMGSSLSFPEVWELSRSAVIKRVAKTAAAQRIFVDE